ncbi:MAG: hypothetical protein NC342_01455 [Pseudoflavonifractor sp.]|nr:hypothetical protein [Alloprevotella sp.]MCM1116191.1 hypothetical protein [Pseudoflavonifractor sp.]
MTLLTLPLAMRHTLITLFAVLGVIVPALSAVPSTEVKAQRYFDQEEWASAEAMYSLLIDSNPTVARYYGQAVASSAMRAYDAPSMRESVMAGNKALLTKALKSRVPVDSLFRAVEASCFSIGHARFYEDFLKLSAESEPWLARKVNAIMLDYFAFRHDGVAMVEYATRLLEGAPDNERFLIVRGEGLMLMGRRAEARRDFLGALDANPTSLTALLYLGEMSQQDGHIDDAVEYYRRANAIAPTPRLAQLIDPTIR